LSADVRVIDVGEEEGPLVKRRVLVVGYPKSGNTWLTRLTAELLNAPVRGFWNEPHREEIAEEGTWRISDTEVDLLPAFSTGSQ
jgi:hypothetical protein